MKAICINLLILLLLSTQAQSQCNIKYKITDPKNVWYMMGGGFGSPPYYYRLKFSDKSISFGGKEYYPLLNSFKLKIEEWKEIGTYYRESEGKLFRLHNGVEKLVIDMCLKVDDKISDEVSTNVVYAVDSIKFDDNQYRRRLRFKCADKNLFTDDIIEGFGSVTGIGIPPLCLIVERLPSVLCYDYDGKKIKSNLSGECWFRNSSFISAENLWVFDFKACNSSVWETRRYKFNYQPVYFNAAKKYQEMLISKDDNDKDPYNWKGTKRYFSVDSQKIFELRNNKEYVVMDFTKNVGDTLTLNIEDEYFLYKVLKIDSIDLNDETRRKRITLSCGTNNNVVWVEGMGNFNTCIPLKNECMNPCDVLELRCHTSRYINAYESPLSINCLRTSTQEAFHLKSAKIFPNPANSEINIIPPADIRGLLTIYDSLGKIISETHYERNVQTKIDISTYTYGIYYYHLKSDDNSMYTGMFVKM
jgi:hypothetical protein